VDSHHSHKAKAALVLAGGGASGAFYEIGALRAIDDLLVDRSIADFDIYVGTSAGALVCTLLVNGFSSYAIMQAISERHPELRGMRITDLFDFHLDGLWRRTCNLPRTVAKLAQHTLTHWRDFTLYDVFWELADILPGGIYDTHSLDRYLRTILDANDQIDGGNRGRTNNFDELSKELYIVATALDSGARRVFGPGLSPSVPISTAVAASSAVPILYRPVEIDNCDYVDGALHGAASLDLAIEAGAKLVVCINPMVPLDASRTNPGERYIRRNGLQAIINQSVRTLLHSSVRYHVKSLRAKHPDVDIILIQPQWDDQVMFSVNPMHYRSRLIIAEHGFESVTHGLLENYDYFSNVLARHNIRIAKRRVRQELHALEAAGYAPDVMEQILVS
jgi:predicted acylesterase/phospholipase RssA